MECAPEMSDGLNEATPQLPASSSTAGIQDGTHLHMVHIQDEAVNVEEAGAMRRKAGADGSSNEPPRMMVLSSKVKFSQIMQNAILPHVRLVVYRHDQCDLDGILSSIVAAVGVEKFESIALIFWNIGTTVSLCGVTEKLLTRENIIEMQSVREFFKALSLNHINKSWINARIDLLMCSAALSHDGEIISAEISQICGVQCAVSKDLIGADIPIKRIGEVQNNERNVGTLYFKIDKLRPTSSRQTLALFEKIRIVGKGAFGSAVLYKKKDDDSLVILKEVNMHDLSASERQMALNEVKVLSMLDHPNVISYFDSFEEDGILMIEMDYADGGTLAKYLADRNQMLEEQKILDMFQQLVAAIRHIHGHNILHRDLKTANIFLTKEGVVKVGDFGISKMMTTGGRGADTVVGTPYYISPEMCEGKPYGPKSDIWALGCILYEMACLERTFEGSNLPAVVNKIMKGFYTPVKGNYSEEFKAIVKRMLDKDPSNRPSANELWTDLLPTMMSKFLAGNDSEDLSGSYDKKKRTSSVLFYQTRHDLSIARVDLLDRIKIKQVVCSREHAVIVSTECVVYTYGRGTEGQLGHDDLMSRSRPERVEALKGKSINSACCGDGFSVFASNNGIVITCGDSTTGCLSHSDSSIVTKPKLIEELLSVDVKAVGCGPQHVAIVSNTGEALTWGNGSHGKLGLGSEENHSVPQRVTFPEPVKITDVFCGETGTMFLTDVGSVWACGSNSSNKLGLNNRMGFIAQLKSAFNKTEVDGSKVPCLVRDLCRYKIITISMGKNHTAVLTEGGNLITFGWNGEGQLGSGDLKDNQGLVHVKLLDGLEVERVQCTEYSTVVSTTNGELIYWGSRSKSPPVTGYVNWLEPSKRQPSAGSIRSGMSDRSLSQTSLRNDSLSISGRSIADERKGERSDGSEVKRSVSSASRLRSQSSRTSHGELELQLTPAPLLHFDAERTESVTLTGFTCHEENILVFVETTAPPPTEPKKLKKRSTTRTMRSTSGAEGRANLKNSASSREGGDELSNSEIGSEMDTLGSTMPSWIRQEIEQADSILPVGTDSDESCRPLIATIRPNNTSLSKSAVRDAAVESSSEDEVDVDDESQFTSHPTSSAASSLTRQGKKFNRVQPMPSRSTPSSSGSRQGHPPGRQAFERSPDHRVTSPGSDDLMSEVERLREQNEMANMRMSQMEQMYAQKVDEITRQSAMKTEEKEIQLKTEVQMLREELMEQNKRMQENQQLYLGLREQMLNLQAKPPDRQPDNQKKEPEQAPSKSSICSIQ